jgi:hypothetical protein
LPRATTLLKLSSFLAQATSALVLLSGGDQPVVEGDELWIPAKRRCKSGVIERAA